MTAGEVVGIVLRPDNVGLNVDCTECGKQHELLVCNTDKARCVRPGDRVWTQSQSVYWSSRDLGVSDVTLNRHRTMWDDSHPCCGVK